MTLKQKIVSEQYHGMFDAAKDADLMIGAGLQFIAATVAEKLNIPFVYVCHIPQMFESKHHLPPILPWQNMPKTANMIV